MSKFRTALLAGAAALVLPHSPFTAQAQDIPRNATPLSVPHAFAPNELPPEPPASTEMHNRWEHLRSPYMQHIKPALKPRPGIYHGPAIGGVAWGAAAGDVRSILMPPWSGSIVTGAQGQYANGAIAFETMIPLNKPPIGAPCDNTFRSTATWAGFDGFGGDQTVQQGGIWLTQLGCNSPDIGVFIETYPNSEITITNFPVTRGDTIVIWVYLNQAAQTVTVQFENETEQVATSASLVAPGPFTASTLEWVVERPIYNGAHVPLTNYDTWPIWSANAWDAKTGQLFAQAAATPGDIGATGQFYYAYMSDDNDQMISYPVSRWPDTLIMHTTGSAYCASGPCQPGW
jgi:hypothetical protein